ncbi:unnamed protein product [Rotaria magnacalcarata]
MRRLLSIYKAFYALFIFMTVVWVPIEGFNKRSHTTGVADLGRVAFKLSHHNMAMPDSILESHVDYRQSYVHMMNNVVQVGVYVVDGQQWENNAALENVCRSDRIFNCSMKS